MNNKTWLRGKPKLTEEQKIISNNKQRNRTKIANYVARNKTIDKSCVICGNPGRILHNEENPYCISFICKECSKEQNNIQIAISKRKDIRNILENTDKKHRSIKLFSEKELKEIVENYINSHLLYVGDYCKQIGISRYQFNKALEIYNEKYPKKLVYDAVSNRLSTLQRVKTANSVKLRKFLENK